ncbi:MAG: hypothetical protein ACR2MO_08400 [Acidimicrobiales bacterium]
MSRRRSAFLLMLSVVAGPAPASAGQAPVGLVTTTTTAQREQSTIGVRPVFGLPAISYEIDGSGKTATPPSTAPATRSTQPPVFWVSYPVLELSVGGTACTGVRREAYPDAAGATAAREATDRLWLGAGYPPCATDPVPDRTPATEAVTFWRVTGQDLLPKPAPRIAPGYMLAGKLAYLEAASQPTAHFEHRTPLGVLVVDATSELFVDWGDRWDRSGPLDGPHAGPGGPWPDGTITHFWTDARTYDVRVEQRWRATWRLGEARGTLAGLVTEGRIDDFEVRQLQAVRNR